MLTEPRDGVTSYTRRRHNLSSDGVTSFMMASACTDSNTDPEDSSYDGVLKTSFLSSASKKPERQIPTGHRNTIELPAGNNVVPLRSDTIRLVQNGCSFYGLRSQDPNQHLKDFLELVDLLDIDGENRKERACVYFNFPYAIKLATGLNAFQQDHLHRGGFTTDALPQFFPPEGRKNFAMIS
ncbi:hypothetical protein Tco_1533610 [Tanacetum coccineum]